MIICVVDCRLEWLISNMSYHLLTISVNYTNNSHLDLSELELELHLRVSETLCRRVSTGV